MFKSITKILAVASVATLAACGGGGDDSPAGADPQGIWIGTTNTGLSVSAVVLDNREIWGIYSGGQTIDGALFGNTSVTGNNISVTATDFDFNTQTATTATLKGTVAAKSSISLTADGFATSLTYDPIYDTPATAAAATGTWSYIGRSGNFALIPDQVTIDGSGNFTLNQTGCVSTGSIVPRTGGKNVYNFNLNSVGVGCATGTAILAGVAFIDTTVTPSTFLALGLNSNKSEGLIVIGEKLPSAQP